MSLTSIIRATMIIEATMMTPNIARHVANLKLVLSTKLLFNYSWWICSNLCLTTSPLPLLTLVKSVSTATL